MFQALLAAALLVQAPKLNYTTHAVPLSQAITTISKQAGKRLLVGNDLAREPVILRLTDVAVEDAMARLADAFGAEWVTTDKGPMLTRTQAAVQRLLQGRKARRLGALQKALANLAAVQAKHSMLDAAAASQLAQEYVNMLKAEQQGHSSGGNKNRIELSNRTADARLLADILNALGADALAQIPPGHRVYAIDPTPKERPIPGIEADRIDRYVAERNALATALHRADIGSLHDGMIYTGIQQAATSVEKTPVRVLLEVDNFPDQGLNFSLLVYDANGRQVGRSQWSFERPDSDEWFATRARRLADAAKKPSIKLPSELVALAKRAVSPNGKSAKTLAPAALLVLLRPDLFDPLNLGFSQLVLGIGDQENLNVVATANDHTFITALQACGSGDLKPEYASELLSRWERQRFERRDGWLLSTPADPLYATQTRIDRSSLAAYMQSTHRDGYTSLETWGDLAAANPDVYCSYTAFGYRDIWRGQDAMYDYAPWWGYRLYALLSETQRDALTRGQPLPFGSLGDEQRACVDELVYDWGDLHSTREDTAPDSNQVQYDFESDIRAMPTESLPDGVPDNAPLKEEVKERFFISTEFQSGQGVEKENDQPTDIGWVANLIAQGERPDLFPPGTMETVKAVRYGQQRTITFRILVAPTLRVEARLVEERKPEGDPIPLADLEKGLPPAVWQKLDQRIKELRAIYKKDEAEIRKLHKPDNTPPPPPPV